MSPPQGSIVPDSSLLSSGSYINDNCRSIFLSNDHKKPPSSSRGSRPQKKRSTTYTATSVAASSCRRCLKALAMILWGLLSSSSISSRFGIRRTSAWILHSNRGVPPPRLIWSSSQRGPPRCHLRVVIGDTVVLQQRSLSSSATALRADRYSSNNDRRVVFTSVEEMLVREDRAVPPALDAYGESFGDYDVDNDDFNDSYSDQIDAYELEEMKRHERLEQEFLLGQQQRLNPPVEEPKGRAVVSVVNGDNEKATTSFIGSSRKDSSNAPLFESISEIDVPPRPLMTKNHFDSTDGTPDSSGWGTTTTTNKNNNDIDVDELASQLEQLQQQIYQDFNNGQEFNLNSNAQVSRLLFGSQGGSTEKSVLEAKAASGNRLAKCILQYRSLKQQIARWKRKQDNIQSGRYVSNPSTIVRRRPTSTPHGNSSNYNTAGQNKQEHNNDTAVAVPSDPLMLVDASSYIFRAYHSMPPIHRSDGMPTGAVLGFCNMLHKLALEKMLRGETPRLVLVFDASKSDGASKTFRHEMYPAYKSHRPAAPVDLIPQFALVKQAAHAYGICQIEADSYEADDVIATLARMAAREGLDVNIFSGDKDLMQLVTRDNDDNDDSDYSNSYERKRRGLIQMVDPTTMTRYTYDHVVEKWGVPPEQLGDVLALAGDSADNVPGVPGIGPKIAAQLLQEYGSLENLLKNTDSIKQKARRSKLEEFQEQARLSRVLVELCDDVPWENMTISMNTYNKVSDLRTQPMDQDRILQFFDEMGFQDIRRRFESSLTYYSGKRPNGSRRKAFPKRPAKATIPRPEDLEDVPF